MTFASSLSAFASSLIELMRYCSRKAFASSLMIERDTQRQGKPGAKVSTDEWAFSACGAKVPKAISYRNRKILIGTETCPMYSE